MRLRPILAAVLFLFVILHGGLWPTDNAAAQTGSETSQMTVLFRLLDRNGDGELTAEEVGKEKESYYRRLLRLGDANRDKKLTRSEFLSATGKRLSPVNSTGRRGFGFFNRRRPFGGLSFERLDRNRDGKLSSDELPPPLRSRFEAAMKQLNVTELRAEDFSRVLRAAFQSRQPFSREAFNRLDRNRDGKLTLQEIPEPLRNRFRPLFDRLKKEALTFEDIAAAARNLRNNRPGNKRP